MLLITVLCLLLAGNCWAVKPNIILIIADDLGWNDVGFHGSNQIPTPNIDALAYSGLILQNYYVTPICTPSRAALMTGKYPIHTGMHHGVIYGMEPRGLPLSEKILPQYLKELGYKTHLVGKWHLGSFQKEYLPLNRGFDSHLGFWTGKIDYYDHTNAERGTWGHDFRRGFEVAYDLFGQYATDVYSNEATKIISSHDTSSPLFLTVAHSAVHSGNPYTPLRAPDLLVDSFHNITNTHRRRFAGMLSKLDESVGKVIEALHKKDILKDSIVIFSTDNGGAAAGFNDNAASNYPLRGVKNTLWEGGVRGAGLLWSPLLEKPQRAATQRMHLVDWLPTLLHAVRGHTGNLIDLDGVSVWEELSRDLPSNRTSIVHNIDDIFGSAAITHGKWKLHKGTNYKGAWDGWFGPSGRSHTYDPEVVGSSPAGKAITAMNMLPAQDTMLKIRSDATIKCEESPPMECRPLEAPCLFDILADPCERTNLATREPEALEAMLLLLKTINETVVPPNNQPDDPLGDPKYWGRVFTNFYDYTPRATLQTVG